MEWAALAAGNMPAAPAMDNHIVPGVAHVPAPHNVGPVGVWAPETGSSVSEALVCRLACRSPVALLALLPVRMYQSHSPLRCRLVQSAGHKSSAVP